MKKFQQWVIFYLVFYAKALTFLPTVQAFDDNQPLFPRHRRGTAEAPWQAFQPEKLQLRALQQQQGQGMARLFPPFAKPDYSYYHTRQSLLTAAHEVVARHRDTMKEEVLMLKLGEYATDLTVITVTKSPSKPNPSTKLRVLLDFGQHGREPITSEVALRLLETLGGEVEVPRAVDRLALDRVLSSAIIKIVPMENVNGRAKVEDGAFCERKNGRGVDTNRNWSVDWGKKEKDYDPAEEYPGTAPFSEPEAELLRQLTSEFKPHLWVNVHSGMEALFMPYDHILGVPEDGAAGPMRALLDLINTLHCGRRCTVGSGGGSVGYLAHGTATDYMYQELEVPIAFTWEIYGDNKAHNDDCFRMFNPVTQPLFEEVVSNWTGAFLTLLANLPEALQKMPHRIKDFHSWTLADNNADVVSTRNTGSNGIRGESGENVLARAHQATRTDDEAAREEEDARLARVGGRADATSAEGMIDREKRERGAGEGGAEIVASASLHRRMGPLRNGVGGGVELRIAMGLSFLMLLGFSSLLMSRRYRHQHLPWWHWRWQKMSPRRKESSV